MIIEVQGDYFWSNYEVSLHCNSQKIIKKKNENVWEIANDSNELLISMQFKNITYSAKYGLAMAFFIWMLNLVSGSADRFMFGLPYDYFLEFIVKNVGDAQNIDIFMNGFKHQEPFFIKSRHCTIIKNEYLNVNGYKWRWVLSTVFPLLLLAILPVLVFYTILLKNSMYVAMCILVVLMLAGFIVYGSYIYKVLTLDKAKVKK